MESSSGETDNLRNELRGDARSISNSANKRIHNEVDARKGGAANGARNVASALSRASEELGDDSPSWIRSAFDSASRTVERLAMTVEQKDSRQLSQDAQQIARDHPGSFLAACAFAGFAAARVMQAGAGSSGARRMDSQGMGQGSEPPTYSPTATIQPYVTQGMPGGAIV